MTNEPREKPKEASPLSAGTTTTTDWNKVNVSFKNPEFEHPIRAVGSKSKKQWKNLKQILNMEQSLDWPEDAVRYSTLDAPPSFRPAKKYSDLSGLEAPYTDPQTKLHYAVADEFKMIRKMPSDIVAGYLTMRRANVQLQ